MVITVKCTACQKPFGAPAAWVGKKVRCRGCGTVFTITENSSAGPTDRSAAAPASQPQVTPRAAVRKTAPPPRIPDPPAPEDPFDDLEALASLETTGVISDEEAPTAVRRESRRVVPQEESYSSARRREPVSPVYKSRPSSPFVSIPGEEAIDKYLPLVPIGILTLFFVMVAYRGISNISVMAELRHAPDEVKAKAIGQFLALVAGVLIAVLVVPAPLCLLGVFIASKVMRFANPPNLYWKCLAVVSTPMALTFAYNGFDLDSGLATVSLWISVPAMLGVLWLLLRLRIAPFAAAAGCSAILCVGVPLMILALLFPGRLWASGGSSARNAPRPATPDPAQPRLIAPRAVSPSLAPPVNRAKPTAAAKRAAIEQALRNIHEGIVKYAETHDGYYPMSLDEALHLGLIRDEDIHGGDFMISYFPHALTKVPLPANRAVAYTLVPSSGTRICLFGDGRVEDVEMKRWGEVMRESP